MRFLIALIFATIFVLSLAFLGIQHFYPKEESYRVPIKTFKLDHLTEQETRELFAELNIPWDPKPIKPNLDIPTYQGVNKANAHSDQTSVTDNVLETPDVTISEKIAVLADITVNPDGSVGEVFILGGNDDGKFTQQIKTQIQEQNFEPKIENGEAVEYQFEEVIELEITTE